MVFWYTPLAKAEERLFAAGKAWWRRWQNTHVAAGAPDTELKIEPQDVVVDDHGFSVHHVRLTAAHTSVTATPLVVTHGYASGSGIYYAAAPPLAEKWPGPVYILDSPGCGLSSRPEWKNVTPATCSLEESEGFFVDHLEGWRKAMGLDSFVLCGHSVGGYLAIAYAEKHPAHVERLVLVSPVGLPHGVPLTKERKASLPFLFRTAVGLWEDGWSPFTLVRWGPGNWLMNGYVNRRMAPGGGSWRAQEAMAEYFVANLCHGHESWGGSAHATLLLPGAYARSPLCERIPKLDFGRVGRLSFIYGGDGDWMSASHAKRLQAATTEHAALPIEVATVAGAGHNLMVDNPIGFVEAVMASGAPGPARQFDGKRFGEAALRLDLQLGDQQKAAELEGRRA